jgi:hypothetical protein
VETVNIRPLGPVELVVPGADAMFVAKLPNETDALSKSRLEVVG